MTTDEARAHFEGIEYRIQHIRDTRLGFERYHADSAKRDCLKKLLSESLKNDELSKKQPIKPCDLQLGSLDNRIEQFSKLKPIIPFFAAMDPVDGVTEDMRSAWSHIWPAVLKTLTSLHRACEFRQFSVSCVIG